MYFLGHHGNQLYPSSFRFFSTLETMRTYIEGQRLALRAAAEYQVTAQPEWQYQYHMQLSETLRSYIEGMPYKCYEGELDTDQAPTNIPKKRLARLLDPQE